MELTFKQKCKIWLLKWLAFLLMKLLYATCRHKFKGTPRSGEPCVVLSWHSKIGFIPFCFTRFWRGRPAKTIISDHFDGELIAQISGLFGVGAIRGSSTRGAVRVLATALKEIKAGTDVAITPDGPRGPYHSISDGAVTIAQKSGVNLVFVSFTASKYWRLKSWDKQMIPRPFCTITHTLTEPFSVAGLTLEEAKKKIAEVMEEE